MDNVQLLLLALCVLITIVFDILLILWFIYDLLKYGLKERTLVPFSILLIEYVAMTVYIVIQIGKWI